MSLTALRFADDAGHTPNLRFYEPVRPVSRGEVVTIEGNVLRGLYEAVGCDIIEALTATVGEGDDAFCVSIYFDEEGKINGTAPDEAATHATMRLLDIETVADVICGPAVVTLFDPETGEEGSLTDKQIEAIREKLS